MIWSVPWHSRDSSRVPHWEGVCLTRETPHDRFRDALLAWCVPLSVQYVFKAKFGWTKNNFSLFAAGIGSFAIFSQVSTNTQCAYDPSASFPLHKTVAI